MEWMLYANLIPYDWLTVELMNEIEVGEGNDIESNLTDQIEVNHCRSRCCCRCCYHCWRNHFHYPFLSSSPSFPFPPFSLSSFSLSFFSFCPFSPPFLRPHLPSSQEMQQQSTPPSTPPD